METLAAPLLRHRFRAMGTEIELLVATDEASGALAAAEAEFHRLEALLSRFRPDSELSRLNDEGTLAAGPDLLRVVELALAARESTGGRFDIRVHGALVAAGYDRSFELVAPDDATPARFPERQPGGVEVRDGVISLEDGVRLDLGGIGKGYAADLVAEGLVARGAVGACVSLGGDVRAAGDGPSEGRWAVPVEDPLDESREMFTYPLEQGAIVTSTVRFRQWVHLGRRCHHIIDPATGAPARTGVVAVVVADAQAWRAEVLAKAALVAGVDAGRALLERHGVEAWIVSERPPGIHE